MSAQTAVHQEIARIALRVSEKHGFALAGGVAMDVYDVLHRPTEDVDLFTNQLKGVKDARKAVARALRAAGYTVTEDDKTGGLEEIFPGMDDELAEWVVSVPGGQEIRLQLAYLTRCRPPVVTPIGQVLHMEDLVGGKVAALALRAEPRDLVDVAALLDRGYSVAQLIALARRMDPSVTPRDFADAGQRLDQTGDEAFARYGLAPADIQKMRRTLAVWPRPGFGARRR